MIISIETGSITKYFNSTAPIGWTKLTANDDCAIRVTSGTTGSGGTSAFSTVFSSQPISGSVTAGSASLGATASPSPTHQHRYTFEGGASAGAVPTSFSGTNYSVYGPNAGSYTSGSAGAGGTHNHPITPAGSISVSSNLLMNVKYVDAILAQRD